MSDEPLYDPNSPRPVVGVVKPARGPLDMGPTIRVQLDKKIEKYEKALKKIASCKCQTDWVKNCGCVVCVAKKALK